MLDDQEIVNSTADKKFSQLANVVKEHSAGIKEHGRDLRKQERTNTQHESEHLRINTKIAEAREDAEAAAQHVKEDAKERIGDLDTYYAEALDEVRADLEKVTKQSKESLKAKQAEL